MTATATKPDAKAERWRVIHNNTLIEVRREGRSWRTYTGPGVRYLRPVDLDAERVLGRLTGKQPPVVLLSDAIVFARRLWRGTPPDVWAKTDDIHWRWAVSSVDGIGNAVARLIAAAACVYAAHEDPAVRRLTCHIDINPQILKALHNDPDPRVAVSAKAATQFQARGWAPGMWQAFLNERLNEIDADA